MIHQFIFAAPKPGMTESEFQDYWVNVHAVKYASKIPQIKQYSVSTRMPMEMLTSSRSGAASPTSGWRTSPTSLPRSRPRSFWKAPAWTSRVGPPTG